jgi:hypothetical protein
MPMPDVIACRSCDRRLRVDEGLAGREVRCPACGVQFTAAASAAPWGGGSPHLRLVEPSVSALPSATSWDGPPRIAFLAAMIDNGPPFTPADAAGWGRVRLGLLMILVSIGTTVAAVVFGVILGLLNDKLHRCGLNEWASMAADVALSTPLVPFLAGLILCATAPAKRKARILGAACLALFVAALACLVPALLLQHHNALDIQKGLGCAVALLASAGAIVFCTFLLGIARMVNYGQPRGGLIWLTVFTCGAAFLVFLLAETTLADLFSLQRLAILHSLDWIGPVCFLAVLAPVLPVWSFATVFKVRNAIAAYLKP